MKTILLPTDFTDVSKNAAMYAIKFAAQLKYEKIILYNTYQQPIVSDESMQPIEFIDFNAIKELSENGLANFAAYLKPYASGIHIETISEFALITARINEVCEENNADIIVMGVTGGNGLEEAIVGSTAIDVSRVAEVPVIIVPPNASFTAIEQIMFACDFEKIVETTPVSAIKKIVDETKAKLLVLNINYHAAKADADMPFQSLMLDTLLQGYQPEYYFTEYKDFIEGINAFAEEHQVDLIITIPKRHGFFERLFHKSHTKQLAFHSHVPLIILHD